MLRNVKKDEVIVPKSDLKDMSTTLASIATSVSEAEAKRLMAVARYLASVSHGQPLSND